MGIKEAIKEKAKNNPKSLDFIFKTYNWVVGRNKLHVDKKSKLIINSSILKSTRINIIGSNNKVVIRDLCRLTGSYIYINGNNNVIDIGKENGFENSTIWIEDDNNKITIDEHSRFFTQSQVAATEGKSITIGRDCLIAPNVQIRTGDSHSILDMDGNRTNLAKDVSIGNHVWIGGNCAILKGSKIPDDTVISTNSLVNKVLEQSFCVYGGTPAKLIKENVKWDSKRI